MGLIKAASGSIGGVLADQWKEYFYCEALEKEVLVVKGEKRISGRSSNTKGNDNIISNGSGIAVADGQCMIIVEQGKVVEVCAEPGEYTYDTSSEPSIFSGDLGESIKESFRLVGKRFALGGDTGKDQRVYYFNTKELVDNKFGTPNPIPFRIVDRNIGLDVDVSVRCSGIYSYKIVDPLLFYTNVCGNVENEYSREEIDSQLKAEFVSALQPAFSRISELQIRPSAIPGHTEELCEAMNDALTKKWTELRGLAVVSIGMNPVTLPEEDAEMIKEAQRIAIMRDPTMAAATLVGAQAEAMKGAASNEGGGVMGFMGMGMAQQAGGMNAQNLFNMGQQQGGQGPQGPSGGPAPGGAPTPGGTPAPGGAPTPGGTPATGSWICDCGTTNSGNFCMNCANPKPSPKPPAGSWNCACGEQNTGKFCSGCGSPRPAADSGWNCACGALNKGKFCSECGQPKPAGEVQYACDKCHWEPDDPTKPPKFCPECGDPFDENDAK